MLTIFTLNLHSWTRLIATHYNPNRTDECGFSWRHMNCLTSNEQEKTWKFSCWKAPYLMSVGTINSLKPKGVLGKSSFLETKGWLNEKIYWYWTFFAGKWPTTDTETSGETPSAFKIHVRHWCFQGSTPSWCSYSVHQWFWVDVSMTSKTSSFLVARKTASTVACDLFITTVAGMRNTDCSKPLFVIDSREIAVQTSADSNRQALEPEHVSKFDSTC